MWLAPDAIATWEAVGVGTRGGQPQYSDLAIETALTLRLIFHLPLRQGVHDHRSKWLCFHRFTSTLEGSVPRCTPHRRECAAPSPARVEALPPARL